MRYKTQVSNKLDAIKNAMSIIERGLEERRMTPEEIHQRILNTKKFVEEAIELVDKEPDEYGFHE